MNGAWSSLGLAGRARDERPLPADLAVVLSGVAGPQPLAAPARDLLRVAVAVHAIERALSGYPGTNRAVRYDVHLDLEGAQWSKAAHAALADLLRLQDDAQWRWTFSAGNAAAGGADSRRLRPETRSVDRIVLFSGGLDSTSGIVRDQALADNTQLVSHYSRQKSAQLRILESTPYRPPAHARITGSSGRGRSFLHRSFYFLCLGAAVATTYGVRRIVQYENGILALAIPPAPPYFMTRHAHPAVHRAAERLFEAVLGGAWTIENPFLKLTKRECVEAMRAIAGAKADAIIALTESCWYTNSNQFAGGTSKPNGVPCGACIPCLVRRSATGRPEGHFDVLSAHPSEPLVTMAHHAYQALVAQAKAGPGRLYLNLPAYVRDLTSAVPPPITRDELIGLVERFAQDYDAAFRS